MDIKKIAQIARIHIEDSEIQAFSNKLDAVYKWLEDIKKIDVSSFRPMYNAHNYPSTAIRIEENPEFHSPSVTLSNAPLQSDNFIIVPKVVEK